MTMSKPNGHKLVSLDDFHRQAQAARDKGEEPGDAPVIAVGSTVKVESADSADDRLLRFVISTSEVDRHGDTVSVEGWDLSAFKTNPVVLWAHDYGRPPIGRAPEIFVEDKKLKADVQFTPRGMSEFNDLIHDMYLEGFLNTVSVGFRPMEFSFVEEDDNRPWGIDFEEQELLEFSAVPVPANASALIEARSFGLDLDILRRWAKTVLRETVEKPPVDHPPPEPGKRGVQSVVFDKSKWSESDARGWLKDHDYYTDGFDETESSYRFRQFNPEHCKPDSYMTLTENLPDGVSLLSCEAKGNSSALATRALRLAQLRSV